MIKLFIAQTLDGYIARKDGSLDWLTEIPVPEGVDYGYGEFIAGIGTVVMGRKTYEEILGFDVEWPYVEQKTVIFSSNEKLELQSPNTQRFSTLNKETLNELINISTKDIWIVGGGELIKEFLNVDAIDEMLISIVPIILGEGIPLFPEGIKEAKFTLQEIQKFETGIVNLSYSRL